MADIVAVERNGGGKQRLQPSDSNDYKDLTGFELCIPINGRIGIGIQELDRILEVRELGYLREC